MHPDASAFGCLLLGDRRCLQPRYNRDMAKFAELNGATSREGFEGTIRGTGFSRSASADHGCFFGLRILKSLDRAWTFGDTHNWDRATIERQLHAVANGDVTLVPSPAKSKQN